MGAVERAIAEELDVSRHTVQWWRKGNVPSEIDQVEYLVRHCVQFGRLDRVWARNLLTQAGHLNPKQLLAELFPGGGKTQAARVFVCYARDVEPDESIGLRVSQALSEPYHVRGVTITIKGPRQMGKSSLLMRVSEAAQQAGKGVAFLDFQLFKASMVDADTFFRQFCASLSRRLGLEDRAEEYWSLPLTNPFRCSEYVGHYLLDALDRPLVLAMDEVDGIFETEFQTDFFAMLRTWHNSRAFEPTWKRLDLALVTSTEPYCFIDNLNQSPFNVGEVIELRDFTAEQVAELNRRHGSPLHDEQEQHLMALLNGHPYLVHRALYQVASRHTSADDLFAQAADDRGPFGNHLRSLLYRLHHREDLMAGLQQVVRHHACEDEEIYHRLRGAGLVRREGRTVLPRCRLYGDFFQRYFDG